TPGWRRGRDSNPRDPEGSNGFRDRPIQPLSHLSGREFLTTYGCFRKDGRLICYRICYRISTKRCASARTCSSVSRAYRCVTRIEECPRASCKAARFPPSSTHRVANVWRSWCGWNCATLEYARTCLVKPHESRIESSGPILNRSSSSKSGGRGTRRTLPDFVLLTTSIPIWTSLA